MSVSLYSNFLAFPLKTSILTGSFGLGESGVGVVVGQGVGAAADLGYVSQSGGVVGYGRATGADVEVALAEVGGQAVGLG